MSISPAEIRHVRLRRRLFGLKKKDVQRELDRIADSFGEVWRQRQDLEERNHEIAVELARHQEAEAMLRKTLVTAERSADVASPCPSSWWWAVGSEPSISAWPGAWMPSA